MQLLALRRGRVSRARVALACLLLAAACGGGQDGADKAETAPAAADPARATFAPSLGVDLAQMTKLPSGVLYRDLIAGEGKVLAAGEFVAVKYTGWLVDGTEFDATGPDGSPFVFKLGSGQVIKGWDEGLVGMKVGGIRQLVIPSDLGYGPAGAAPKIPPNAVLVFRVEVLSAD